MTNIEPGRTRLVGLCGDRREQHTLAFLMTYDDDSRGYIEVSTRDAARDLAGSLHLELAGVRIGPLVEDEGWVSLLANDTPEAILADAAVEKLHVALARAAGHQQAEDETLEQVTTLLDQGSSVLVTGVDTVEMARAIRLLGGVVVQLDWFPATGGTPLGAIVWNGVDLAIPLHGPSALSPREAMQEIEQCLRRRQDTTVSGTTAA